MFEYLTSEDWEEFKKKFPDTYGILLCKDLVREKEYCQNALKLNVSMLPGRKQWLENRLEELLALGY